MKSRRLISILAAAGMAVASVSASAATSIDRASPAIGASSFLQDDDDDGGSTAIILGVVLVVLIAAVAIAGTSNEDAAGSP